MAGQRGTWCNEARPFEVTVDDRETVHKVFSETLVELLGQCGIGTGLPPQVKRAIKQRRRHGGRTGVSYGHRG